MIGRNPTPPAVVITGPAGIGKSHALDALRRDLTAAGWTVVHASALPDDSRAPLRALHALLAQFDVETVNNLLDRLAEEAGTPSAGSHGWRDVLSREVRLILDRQAERASFVIVLDDVQWADSQLQGLLTDLLDTKVTRRWAVVLAGRSGEKATRLALPRTARRFELAPLSREATASLVRHTSPRLGDQEVQRVATRSGGNPLFAIELARQGAAAIDAGHRDSAVPQLILDLLKGRLAHCSKLAQRALSVVALLGNDASVEVVLRVGESASLATGKEVLIDALDELLHAELLEETPSGVRMTHPLLRDASLTMVTPARRAALHSVIASELEGEAAARHRVAAFEATRERALARAAAQAGFSAGLQARRVFADDVALELFMAGWQAFEVMSPAGRRDLAATAIEAWLQIGEIHQDRDQRGEAERAFDAAGALVTSDEQRARVWSAKASLAYRIGDFGGAVHGYEQGVASLRGRSPLVRARLEADLGWAYSRMGNTSDALTKLEGAMVVLSERGDGLTAGRALDQLATVLGMAGRPDEGLEAMHRAFAAMGSTGNERELGILHLHRAAIYGALSRYGEALADISAALRVAKLCGDRYRQSVLHWLTSDIHESRGDPLAALAERRAELELLAEIGNRRHTAAAHAARARLLVMLGRHDEADDAEVQARAIAVDIGDESFSASIEERLKASFKPF